MDRLQRPYECGLVHHRVRSGRGSLSGADRLGSGLSREANASSFSVEAHITYQREVHQGDLLEFRTKLIGFDAKKIHYIQMMYRVADGLLSSTAEWLILYVDMNTRRTASMPEAILERLRDLQRRQADLPLPPEAGRAIKQKG